MARYRFAVSDLLKAKGWTTAYKVGKALSKPPAQASRLIDPNRTQINISLVNELCEKLNCTPADLFVRVDEKANGKGSAKKR